jgi:tetratricopeptide (TPR) repeat protein
MTLASARPQLLAIALSALFTGCALQPPAPVAAPVAEEPVAPAPAHPPAVLAYDAQQRAAAETAAREGRWADALWAWDIVLAISPQDSEAQRRRQVAQAQAQQAINERLALARAARARGQADQAGRHYLDVLAIAPGQLEAANALRAIERERARRQAVGGFARPLTPPDPTRSDAQARAAARRLDLEHASLLAGQGDVDAAIALLLPTPASQPADAASRKLLADLLVQRADRLASADPAAAIEALRQSLRWQPGHAEASARLQLLQAKARGAAEPAPRRPLSKPSSGPSSGR